MKKLMEAVARSVKNRLIKANLDTQENEIRKFILQEFANIGKAPSSREILESLKISSLDRVDQTIKKLEKVDLLEKAGNEIISSYPFSANKTRHKVIFEDNSEVYALCATDAMGIHFMMDKNITIESNCPQCERKINIIVKEGQIDSYNPEGTVEYLSIGDRGGCTAKNICPFINFFCSKDHLEDWRENNHKYKNGMIFSLNDVLEHGKMIFSDLLK